MTVTTHARSRRPVAVEQDATTDKKTEPIVGMTTPRDHRESTIGDLLKFAGTWEGDDFEACLDAVISSRSQVNA